MNDLITRLRFALYRYGDHFASCEKRPCTCGFREEWAAARLPDTFGDVVRIAQLNELPDLPDDKCLTAGCNKPTMRGPFCKECNDKIPPEHEHCG